MNIPNIAQRIYRNNEHAHTHHKHTNTGTTHTQPPTTIIWVAVTWRKQRNKGLISDDEKLIQLDTPGNSPPLVFISVSHLSTLSQVLPTLHIAFNSPARQFPREDKVSNVLLCTFLSLEHTSILVPPSFYPSNTHTHAQTRICVYSSEISKAATQVKSSSRLSGKLHYLLL